MRLAIVMGIALTWHSMSGDPNAPQIADGGYSLPPGDSAARSMEEPPPVTRDRECPDSMTDVDCQKLTDDQDIVNELLAKRGPILEDHLRNPTVQAEEWRVEADEEADQDYWELAGAVDSVDAAASVAATDNLDLGGGGGIRSSSGIAAASATRSSSDAETSTGYMYDRYDASVGGNRKVTPQLVISRIQQLP